MILRPCALALIAAAIVGCASSSPSPTAPTSGPPNPPRATRLVVGSGYWGEAAGGALTLYDLSEQPGLAPRLTMVSRFATGGLLSFLLPAGNDSLFYAADEENGAVLWARLEGDRVTVVGRKATSGHPVYLAIAERRGRRFLLTANYNEGLVEAYALGGDGALGALTGSEKTGAHAHSIVPVPGDNAAVLVANEGADTITVLTLGDDGSFKRLADVPSPAGPRHLAVHGDTVYVTHERSVTLGWLRWNAADRTLKPLGVTPPLAAATNAEGKVTAAHLVVEGSELFMTVRAGSQSELLAFRLDPGSAPTVTARSPSLGATPRHFTILPKAEGYARLLVGNQDGRSIALVTPGAPTQTLPVDIRPFFLLPVATAPSPPVHLGNR